MDRKEFFKSCGLACVGGIGIAAILQSCATGQHFASSEIVGNKLNVMLTEFTLNKKGESVDRKYVLVRSEKLNFPILVRPSYVLGGQSMKIVINEKELEEHVVNLLKDHPGNQVLVDHFLENAIEAEADAICDGENVHIIGIMEHIEPAGIHSGDSHSVLPPFDLSDHVIQQIEAHTRKIAVALKTVGLINIQFAIKNEIVYIIEANPRASRTVPFICKHTMNLM